MNNKKNVYLNGLSVWALSFGGIIGWGCFIMPGTAFLPDAGPLGSVIGIFIATLFALLICVNYSRMIKQFPESGGSYVYTKHILGEDHAFLVAWCLLLAYLSLLWANATAFSYMLRFVVGDLFQFGFHYNFAGYEVYWGEVFLTILVTVFLGLVTAYHCKIANFLRSLLAISLFVSVIIIFVTVVSNVGFSFHIQPAFSRDEHYVMQIVNVFVLAPWMFVGFECATHTVGESKIAAIRIFLYAGLAILCGMLVYIMLTFVAAAGAPAPYTNWKEYIQNADQLSGFASVPVFYNASVALGEKTVRVLVVATMSALLTSVLTFCRSAARVIQIMSENQLMPERFSVISKDGIPVKACLLITAISIPVPFIGRAVIGWNADVSSLCVSVVYAYISICSLRTSQRRTKEWYLGIMGAILSVLVLSLLLIPNVFADSTLSFESYFMLAVWSLMGIFYYWHIFSKDKENRFGKSTIMWLMMLLLLFFSTNVWVRLLTEGNLKKHIIGSPEMINKILRTSSLLQFSVISLALVIVFSLFRNVISRQKEANLQAIRAKEQDKAKSMFLSNMSHDIRTPMNTIVGMTDILRREELPGHAMEYVNIIKSSGDRLLSLIDDILDFSRIESGKIELVEEEYRFTDMIKDLSVLFLNRIGGKPVTLVYDIDPSIPNVLIGDQKRFSQIMTNIVGNATKYTDHGFVKVKIDSEEKTPHNIILHISVSDSGRGIREEDFETIFHSFSQVDTKKNRGIEGTGLGLAISKQLIELMGGTIGVESEYGKGSRFFFDIFQRVSDEKDNKITSNPVSVRAGGYCFDNPYERSSFETLFHKLNLQFSPIQSEEELTSAVCDFFITDQYHLAKRMQETKGGSCMVALLQNPLQKSYPGEGFFLINKPLYYSNFLAFLNGESYDSITYIEPELFRAPEARILLVDDMPINNRITSELLRPLCMEIDTASNGKEAIEKILAKDYDIVFMDHMMPIMDGIEAITEIRKMESGKYKELPVVALTANATVEAKKLFFECGFSDFLSKPIRFEEVLICLRTWLKPELIHPGMDMPVTEEPPSLVPTDVHIPGIDPALGVENAGNAKLFFELLGDVYEIIDSKCAAIRESMESKNWKAFTTDVHALKTTCRMMGAMELSNAFYELEKMGNKTDSDSILAEAPPVLSCFESLKPYLESYVPKSDAPNKNFDEREVEKILKELVLALENYDLSSAEECINNLSSYEFDETLSEKVKKICELVRNLDYDEALDLINNR